MVKSLPWRKTQPSRATLDSHARTHNIPLSAEHLIFGASAAEIAELLPKQEVAA